jgi:hypothetical protein
MGDDVVSVELWRGYVMGRFYARRADSDVAVAVSPCFRIAKWPWEERVSLKRDQTVISALAALKTTLVEAGWQRISDDAGAHWYQLSFRHPLQSGSLATPARQTSNGRIHLAERIRDAHTDIPHLVEPTIDRPAANGHAVGEVSEEIVAALQAGPLTSSELCGQVGRSSGAVRIARRELELAGLVRRAAPPAGRSRRAIYWQLSR